MAVESASEFNQWLDALAERSNIDITNFDSYMTALNKQHDFFHQVGCRLSDHGIETAYALDYTDQEIKMIFDEIRSGKELPELKILKFKSAMLYHFGVMDAAKGWTQQYHLGAIRNNNSRLFKSLGPDTGFDSIGDFDLARPLAKLLDRLDSNNQLAKTILYNLNPRDNEVLATMIGNFQDGSVAGKMQLGSGWWFLDQMEGMTRQIEALSQLGLLSRFVGMLTDSRSFLSYTRHDYFRRILCNILGNDLKKGLLPNDIELLGNMVQDISYNNAANYFGFEL
jgi:glucuronate isomerase